MTRFTAPLFPKQSIARAGLRRVTCQLADIAWREHPEYRAHRALEHLLYAPLLAVSHAERVFIALAVYWRYGGGAEEVPAQSLLQPEDQAEAQLLGLALRLAETLASGSAALLNSCRLLWESGQVALALPKAGPLRRGDAVERRLAQLNRFIEERDRLLPVQS